MTAALHVTTLPELASSWPDEVCSIIEAKLAGEIDPQDLRMVVLAPAADRMRLGVWLGVEWENYPDAEDATSAAGFVSLAPWLDRVDAIARGEHASPAPADWQPRREIRFADPVRDAAMAACGRELHDALVATAIEVATRRLAMRFTQPVGIFVSPTGSDARVVAFCHPHGAPLWALREHREEHGYGSAYPQGSLRDRRLTIFYPAGEGADEGSPSIRSWGRDDIARATHDRGQVAVWFAGETFPVQLAAGHTQEGAGGPDGAQIVTALADLLEELGVMVHGEPPPPELPADAEAFGAELVALPDDGDRLHLTIALAKAYGIATIGALVEYATLPDKIRGLAHRTLADVALDADDWAAAFAHIDRVTGEDRWAWMEVRALVGLGRWEAVLALAEDSDRAERALALRFLGRVDEAFAAIGDSTDDQAIFVRALLEADRDLDAALAILRSVLAEHARPHILMHVAAEPRFAADFAAQRAFEAELAASRLAAADVALEPLDLAGVREVRMPAAHHALGTPLEASLPDARYDRVLRRAASWWLADSDGGLFEAVPGQVPRPLTTFPNRLDALVETPAGVVVRSGLQLALLDAAGTTRATASSRVTGDGPLAARGDLLAAAQRDSVLIYEAATLRLLGCLAMPGEATTSGLGFVAADRLVVKANEQLLLVDVGDPSCPVVRRRWHADVSLLHVSDRRIALSRGDRVFVVDVAGDELRPALVIHADSTPLWLDVPGKLGVAWRGHVAVIDGERVSHTVVFGPDGFALEARAIELVPGGAVAATERGLEVLAPLPFDAPAIEASVEAFVPRVREWLFARIDALAKNSAEVLGGVVIEWYVKEWVGLRALPACSVVAISSGIRDQLAFEEPAEEPEPDDLSDEERERGHSMTVFREQIARAARARACRALAGEIAARYGGTLKARTLFVGHSLGDAIEIVHVVAGGGDHPPRRATS